MYYIGIDIGGMSIKAGIVDENGVLYAKYSVETAPERHYSAIVKDIAALCDMVMEKAKLSIADIVAVGMGIPGTIDGATGMITYSNNINFEQVPIIKEFNKYINLPTYIGNDANCAVLGEVKFGAVKGVTDAVLITLGTGVGSGIIIDGKMLVGRGGAGAEAGHTCVSVGGEKCTCGRRGCWEAYASATALIRQTAKASEKHPDSLMTKIIKDEGKVSGRTAFKAARAGDKVGLAVVKKYVQYVGEGLVDMVNIFRPDALIIGGGVSNEGDYFIDMLQEFVSKYSYGGSRNYAVKVVKATLLNDAGILGAAALCL